MRLREKSLCRFVLSVRKAVARLEGSYALGILCTDLPDTIVAAKKDSPLIFGYGDGENYIASDVPALLAYTRECMYIEQGELCVLTQDGITIKNQALHKGRETLVCDISAAADGLALRDDVIVQIFQIRDK